MNTQKKTRKLMAESRQHQEHIKENVLHRSQEEIQQSGNQNIELEARESIAEQRQRDRHTKETMLSRSEAEINETETSKNPMDEFTK